MVDAGGRVLGIVTAKRLRTVELALDRFPILRETADVVIGADDTERHKPDPDPLLAASTDIIASADGAVLDRCARWFNLARACVSAYIPAAYVVDLRDG